MVIWVLQHPVERPPEGVRTDPDPQRDAGEGDQIDATDSTRAAGGCRVSAV